MYNFVGNYNKPYILGKYSSIGLKFFINEKNLFTQSKKPNRPTQYDS